MEEYESIDAFYARFKWICHIFPLEDKPSVLQIFKLFTHLLSLFKRKKQVVISEFNTCQDTSPLVNFYCRFDSIESTIKIENVAHQHMIGFCDAQLFLDQEQEDVPKGTKLIPNGFIPLTFPLYDFETYIINSHVCEFSSVF